MRLYLFEHCSLCFRVRMTAALKHLPLRQTVVLDDDSATMISLVGKRQIPILVKDDGEAMLESLAMVRHIEACGEPLQTGPRRDEVARWADRFAERAAPLTWPRYPLLGLPEFATAAARAHYERRKREAIGDLAELRAQSDAYLQRLVPELDALERLIASPHAVNGALSLDDVLVLPLLRSAAVIKELVMPPKVRGYFVTMMERVGYEPLPAI